MRHAHRNHRPMYRLMALTTVFGAATVGVVILASDGNPPGYDYPKDAAYGAVASPDTSSTAAPTTAAPTTAASTTAVPAPGSTPVVGTAPTTRPDGALGGSGTAADAAGSGPAPAARVATRGSGRLLAATLTGDVEVPAPGDPDGVGVAAVRVAAGRVCLEAVVTGLQPITAVHIHRGARGVAGPVAVEFAVTGTASTARCTSVDPALAGRIRGNPENWYVNVHTAAFAKGALRGQLMW